MGEINDKNIEKLLQTVSSEELLIQALKSLKITKSNIRSRIVTGLICLVISLFVGFNDNTVNIINESLSDILNVMIAILGIVFTGYALLQAFMGKELLIQLMVDVENEGKANEKSKLQATNENFIYLMIILVIVSIITLILKIVMAGVSNDWMVFEERLASNLMAGVLIFVYFSFIGIALYRVIAFLTSIFQLFNMYSISHLIKILKEDKGD